LVPTGIMIGGVGLTILRDRFGCTVALAVLVSNTVIQSHNKEAVIIRIAFDLHRCLWIIYMPALN
jgi:hypothetical protein